MYNTNINKQHTTLNHGGKYHDKCKIKKCILT